MPKSPEKIAEMKAKKKALRDAKKQKLADLGITDAVTPSGRGPKTPHAYSE